MLVSSKSGKVHIGFPQEVILKAPAETSIRVRWNLDSIPVGESRDYHGVSDNAARCAVTNWSRNHPGTKFRVNKLYPDNHTSFRVTRIA